MARRFRSALCVTVVFVSLVYSIHGWAAVPVWVVVATGLVYLSAAWIVTASLGLARYLGFLAGSVVVSGIAGAALLHVRHQTDLVQAASEPGIAIAVWLMLVIATAVVLQIAPRVKVRDAVRGGAVAAGVAVLALATLHFGAPPGRWFVMERNGGLGALAGLFESRAATVDDYLAETGLPEGAPRSHPGFDAVEAGPLPNVVFILIDTLRADSLSRLGGSHGSMPRLDSLSESAILFTDVWANATWTRPSVASWFTGMVPETVGVRDEDDRLPDEAWTLAEMLAARGYQTVGFSTNFHVSAGTGFHQGFSRFTQLPDDGYAHTRADEVRREVSAWLASESRERPIFAYIHLMDPHSPYESGVGDEPWLPRRYLPGYRAELRFLDEQLVGLIASLRHDLGPDLWLVIGSDHGESFGDRGAFGHGDSLYLDEAWVPVLVLGPGTRPGLSRARLEARDFFTLFDALARPRQPDVLAWARGRHRDTRYLSSYRSSESAFIRWLFPYRVVRLQGLQVRNRLTIRSDFGSTWASYDLLQDPAQHRPRWELSREELDRVGSSINAVIGAYSPGEDAGVGDEEIGRLRALGYIR